MKALRLSSMFSPYESNYMIENFPSASCLRSFLNCQRPYRLRGRPYLPDIFSASPNFGQRRKTISGDDRVRTGDPRLAKAVLCQLSYIPVRSVNQPGLAIGLRPTTAA